MRAGRRRVRVKVPFRMNGHTVEVGRVLELRETVARALHTSGRAELLPNGRPKNPADLREKKVLVPVEEKSDPDLEDTKDLEPWRCHGITASGLRCRRTAKHGGYCAQHIESGE